MTRRQWTANLMLLGAALAWGSTFVPCKIAAVSLGTFFFNGLRFLLGGLFVLAMAGPRLRGLSRQEIGGARWRGSSSSPVPPSSRPGWPSPPPGRPASSPASTSSSSRCS